MHNAGLKSKGGVEGGVVEKKMMSRLRSTIKGKQSKGKERDEDEIQKKKLEHEIAFANPRIHKIIEL
jgi:hypothetical protein